jgi:hypothetical protein
VHFNPNNIQVWGPVEVTRAIKVTPGYAGSGNSVSIG